MKKPLLSILFLHFASIGYGQLTVVPGGTAATIVNALVDPVLNPSNPLITGGTANYGTFTAAGAALTKVGSTTGVIFSTGKAADASKNPSTQASTPGFAVAACSGTGSSAITDADLDGLIGTSGATFYDRTMLEFDILPSADSLLVTYVFGSEEYYTYCTDNTFSDLFGFFVKPKVGGPYVNFAWVPGTNPPQSVNVGNIYPANCSRTAPDPPTKNTAYFVDNTAGNTGVVYNGLTVPLQAKIKVTAGTAYHIKIAIADKGDECLDAGLFIKAFGFAVPIELISFNASKKGNSSLLAWNTATEKNNDHFDILRSIDGHNFETIGTLKGAGNSSVLKHYEFIDQMPMQGLNYYRLRQVDNDGKTSYSEIKPVTTLLKVAATPFYPNPASTASATTQINVPFDGLITSRCVDITGKIVQELSFEVKEGLNTIVLPTAALPQGFYFVTFKGDSYESEVLKIVR